MKAPILNALTPWGWAAAGLLVLTFLILAAGAVGFRWDPLRLNERRLERAQTDLAVVRADLSARRIEQAAEVGQRARLDSHHRQTTAVAALTAAAQTEARSAPDADQPLDADRTRRLHDLDRRLCGLAANLEGCAATASAAGRGDPSLRLGDPAS